MGGPPGLKLLLDTHVWIWGHLHPERIKPQVGEALRSPENELWLSPVSVWEALLLIERGKIEVDVQPPLWIREALAATPMKEATLNNEVAIRSRTVDLPHRDPADRFLAATAEVYELTLVTEDERLLTKRSWNVLPNRA
ncbi:MAG: type II toxin-antitoxin system VapC family toxin [Gemmatimonadota bacterium]